MAAEDLAVLLDAASSPDWAIRAEAGRQLAARAERPDAAAALHRLLLDAHDTAVTDAVAQALLERDDAHGTRLLAQAAAVADEEQLDHLRRVDLGVTAEFRSGMPG